MHKFLNQKLTLIHLITVLVIAIGILLIINGNNKKENVASYDNGNVTVAVIDFSQPKPEPKTNYKLLSGMVLIALGVVVFAKMYFTKNHTPTTEPLTKLTEKEKEVTYLIQQGKSNKEIATELSISLSTVKTHINNLYKKLSVTSRTELTDLMRDKEV
ncbi:response regulator transcription factor [Flavobacterium litorale]|uniref:LuxR C-terminal-related transcriptional regulator n=1 Tax=Flavobacterium litorale TaxID=2856519 RepID=A0ABX8V2U9_9FLAO|nr:LuxR C-terminal-related transcriptional regulator [Flavobacterium litorale]QYJ67170.1 LuxR C-terminal-related transcriptional regulator [Flavobacterium litorale]